VSKKRKKRRASDTNQEPSDGKVRGNKKEARVNVLRDTRYPEIGLR